MSERIVFVRGTRNLKPQEIRNYFLIFGPVVSVKLPYKRDFAFVKFTTSDTARLVCKEKFHLIEGRKEKVKVSNDLCLKFFFKGVAVEIKTPCFN